MSDVTNLRQAVNKIEVMGLLSEKDIHPNKDDKDVLEGFVSIRVDDINQIRFNIRTNKYKKDSNDINPSYDNLTKFNEEAKSIAEAGLEEASRVEIKSGQLNPYHSSQSGKDVLGYKTSFISIYRGDDFEPKANTTFEIYIKGYVPEVDKDGQETGNAIIKGLLPTFNGIEPLDITVTNEQGYADTVLSGDLEIGETVLVYADIINSKVEKKMAAPMRLGKPRVEYEYVNKLVLTGCSEPYEEDKAFNANAVKLALEEREQKIKDAANKARNNRGSEGGTSKPSGASSGRVANW